jgi:hypothetical protein
MDCETSLLQNVISAFVSVGMVANRLNPISPLTPEGLEKVAGGRAVHWSSRRWNAIPPDIPSTATTLKGWKNLTVGFQQRSRRLGLGAWTAILFVSGAAFSPAQQLFTYKDKSGSLSVQAKSGLVEQTSPNHLHLVLKGSPVKLNSVTDGLQIQAPSVNCDAATQGQTRLQKAVAIGGVHAIKKSAAGTSDITAATGTYTAGAQSARLDLTGNVKIIDSTAKRVTTVTGHAGYAILDPNAKGSGSGLRSAVLSGPVRIDAVQQQTSGGRIVATGSRLEMDNAAHTVTLTGHVNVVGNQKSTLGELHGADRAVLILNSQGQVASVRVTQGASK